MFLLPCFSSSPGLWWTILKKKISKHKKDKKLQIFSSDFFPFFNCSLIFTVSCYISVSVLLTIRLVPKKGERVYVISVALLDCC